MTLSSCYALFGGDYAEAFARLESDPLLEECAAAFLADDGLNALHAALAAQNYEKAYCSAHGLKGVCLNLGYTSLGKATGALSDALKQGDTAAIPALLEATDAEYARTVQALRAFFA